MSIKNDNEEGFPDLKDLLASEALPTFNPHIIISSEIIYRKVTVETSSLVGIIVSSVLHRVSRSHASDQAMCSKTFVHRKKCLLI